MRTTQVITHEFTHDDLKRALIEFLARRDFDVDPAVLEIDFLDDAGEPFQFNISALVEMKSGDGIPVPKEDTND